MDELAQTIHDTCWQSLDRHRGILIHGPKSSGKTTLVSQVRAACGMPRMTTIYCDENLDFKSLIGHFQFSAGKFCFQEGLLLRAILEGTWVLFEGLDMVSDEVLHFLNDVLASAGSLYLSDLDKHVQISPKLLIWGTSTSTAWETGNRRLKRSNFRYFHEFFQVPLRDDQLSQKVSQEFPQVAPLFDTLLAAFRWCQGELEGLGSRQLSVSDFFKVAARLKAYEWTPPWSDAQILRVAKQVQDVWLGFLGPKPQKNLVQPMLATFWGLHLEDSVYQSHLLTGQSIQLEDTKTFCYTPHHTRLVESLQLAAQMGEPLILVGETGTGKSKLVQHTADLAGRPLMVYNFHADVDESDLFGGFLPRGKEVLAQYVWPLFAQLYRSTWPDSLDAQDALCLLGNQLQAGKYEKFMDHLQNLLETTLADASLSSDLKFQWKEFRTLLMRRLQKSHLHFEYVRGSLLTAVREGHWVLLDEINLAGVEVFQKLLSLLKNSEYHDGLGGDVLEIHPDFRVFACMNPQFSVDEAQGLRFSAGKKELPPWFRGEFTELMVPETLNPADLQAICLSVLPAVADLEVPHLYLEIRQLGDADHQAFEEYSLRTLTRALTFARQRVNQQPVVKQAMADGFLMCFTGRDAQASSSLSKAILAHFGLPKKQPEAQVVLGDHQIIVGPYAINRGPKKIDLPALQAEFIGTPTVSASLLRLSRLLSSELKAGILLEGPTSAGKSRICQYLANISGNTLVRINNHEHTDVAEYLGQFMPREDGSFGFVEGPLVEAVRQGYWILLDELNLGPTEVLEALNRLLDDNRQLRLPQSDEVLEVHHNFRLFATQNPAASGYQGRKELSRAFRNRFVCLTFTDFPSADLKLILKDRCQIPPTWATKMCKVFEDLKCLRSTSKVFQGTHGLVTVRDLIKWGDRFRQTHKSTDLSLGTLFAQTGCWLLSEQCRRPFEKEGVQETILKHSGVTLESSFEEHHLIQALRQWLPSRFPHLRFTESLCRLLVLAYEALIHGENVLLVGETGTAKTTVCQVLAQYFDQTLVNFSCHERTEAADFLGGLQPSASFGRQRQAVQKLASYGYDVDEDLAVRLEELGADHPLNLDDEIRKLGAHPKISGQLFEWKDGPLSQALQAGSFFLLDEISLADDSVLERLNSVLDNGSLVLPEKPQKISQEYALQAHSAFRLVATMNPPGDFGKRELSLALRNRFTEIWVPQIQLLECADLFADSALSVLGHSICADYAQTFPVELTLRDLAWLMDFAADSEEKLVHGLHALLVDGLGLQGSRTSRLNQVLSVEQEVARQFVMDSLKDQVNSQVWADMALENGFEWVCPQIREGHLKVGPFTIQCGDQQPVDSGFEFEAPTARANLGRLMRGLHLGKPILLDGPPGTGKTSIVLSLGLETGHPVVRLNISEQTDLSDLLGQEVPRIIQGKLNYVFEEGPFLVALRQGHWVLLDEINLASQPVLEGLNSVLDHRRSIYVPSLDQEVIAHPQFRVFACQNPSQEGHGRKSLPKSFLNRFCKVVLQNLVDQDYERILKVMASKFRLDTRQTDEGLAAGLALCQRPEVNLRTLAFIFQLVGLGWTWENAQTLCLGGRLSGVPHLLGDRVPTMAPLSFEGQPLAVLHQLVPHQIPLLLVGPHGAGKSWVVGQALGELTEIRLHSQYDATELLGSFQQKVVNGHLLFQWVDSDLIKCVKTGGNLLLSACDLCDAAVLDRLNSLLEEDRKIGVSESGEGLKVFQAHPNFRLLLSCVNPHKLSRALRNRCVEVNFEKVMADPQIYAPQNPLIQVFDQYSQIRQAVHLSAQPACADIHGWFGAPVSDRFLVDFFDAWKFLLEFPDDSAKLKVALTFAFLDISKKWGFLEKARQAGWASRWPLANQEWLISPLSPEFAGDLELSAYLDELKPQVEEWAAAFQMGSFTSFWQTSPIWLEADDQTDFLDIPRVPSIEVPFVSTSYVRTQLVLISLLSQKRGGPSKFSSYSYLESRLGKSGFAVSPEVFKVLLEGPQILSGLIQLGNSVDNNVRFVDSYQLGVQPLKTSVECHQDDGTPFTFPWRELLDTLISVHRILGVLEELLESQDSSEANGHHRRIQTLIEDFTRLYPGAPFEFYEIYGCQTGAHIFYLCFRVLLGVYANFQADIYDLLPFGSHLPVASLIAHEFLRQVGQPALKDWGIFEGFLEFFQNRNQYEGQLWRVAGLLFSDREIEGLIVQLEAPLVDVHPLLKANMQAQLRLIHHQVSHHATQRFKGLSQVFETVEPLDLASNLAELEDWGSQLPVRSLTAQTDGLELLLEKTPLYQRPTTFEEFQSEMQAMQSEIVHHFRAGQLGLETLAHHLPQRLGSHWLYRDLISQVAYPAILGVQYQLEAHFGGAPPRPYPPLPTEAPADLEGASRELLVSGRGLTEIWTLLRLRAANAEALQLESCLTPELEDPAEIEGPNPPQPESESAFGDAELMTRLLAFLDHRKLPHFLRDHLLKFGTPENPAHWGDLDRKIMDIRLNKLKTHSPMLSPLVAHLNQALEFTQHLQAEFGADNYDLELIGRSLHRMLESPPGSDFELGCQLENLFRQIHEWDAGHLNKFQYFYGRKSTHTDVDLKSTGHKYDERIRLDTQWTPRPEDSFLIGLQQMSLDVRRQELKTADQKLNDLRDRAQQSAAQSLVPLLQVILEAPQIEAGLVNVCLQFLQLGGLGQLQVRRDVIRVLGVLLRAHGEVRKAHLCEGLLGVSLGWQLEVDTLLATGRHKFDENWRLLKSTAEWRISQKFPEFQAAINQNAQKLQAHLMDFQKSSWNACCQQAISQVLHRHQQPTALPTLILSGWEILTAIGPCLTLLNQSDADRTQKKFRVDSLKKDLQQLVDPSRLSAKVEDSLAALIAGCPTEFSPQIASCYAFWFQIRQVKADHQVHPSLENATIRWWDSLVASLLEQTCEILPNPKDPPWEVPGWSPLAQESFEPRGSSLSEVAPALDHLRQQWAFTGEWLHTRPPNPLVAQTDLQIDQLFEWWAEARQLQGWWVPPGWDQRWAIALPGLRQAFQDLCLPPGVDQALETALTQVADPLVRALESAEPQGNPQELLEVLQNLENLATSWPATSWAPGQPEALSSWTELLGLIGPQMQWVSGSLRQLPLSSLTAGFQSTEAELQALRARHQGYLGAHLHLCEQSLALVALLFQKGLGDPSEEESPDQQQGATDWQAGTGMDDTSAEDRKNAKNVSDDLEHPPEEGPDQPPPQNEGAQEGDPQEAAMDLEGPGDQGLQAVNPPQEEESQPEDLEDQWGDAEDAQDVDPQVDTEDPPQSGSDHGSDAGEGILGQSDADSFSEVSDMDAEISGDIQPNAPAEDQDKQADEDGREDLEMSPGSSEAELSGAEDADVPETPDIPESLENPDNAEETANPSEAPEEDRLSDAGDSADEESAKPPVNPRESPEKPQPPQGGALDSLDQSHQSIDQGVPPPPTVDSGVAHEQGDPMSLEGLQEEGTSQAMAMNQGGQQIREAQQASSAQQFDGVTAGGSEQAALVQFLDRVFELIEGGSSHPEDPSGLVGQGGLETGNLPEHLEVQEPVSQEAHTQEFGGPPPDQQPALTTREGSSAPESLGPSLDSQVGGDPLTQSPETPPEESEDLLPLTTRKGTRWAHLKEKYQESAGLLSEQLRILLVPTVRGKLTGDYRSGKRLNMRKILGFLASNYRKDQIWLRRTKLSKRNYQVSLCIDNSKSMMCQDNQLISDLALQAFYIVGTALEKLDVGEISVVSFGGAQPKLLVPLRGESLVGLREQCQICCQETTTFENCGPILEDHLTFHEECPGSHDSALREALQLTNRMYQLCPVEGHQYKFSIVVSDGRLNKNHIRSTVQECLRAKNLVFFVILSEDAGSHKQSVLNTMSCESVDGEFKLTRYLEDFPFPFYVVVSDTHRLAEVLSDALRQWIQMTVLQ